jgi:hypothetical protein
MRTITGTCNNTEEAERVRHRLEAAGVSRERISFREMDIAAGSAQSQGGSPGVFVIAKVMPGEVASATEILRKTETTATAPVPAADGGEAGNHAAAEVSEAPPFRAAADAAPDRRFYVRGGDAMSARPPVPIAETPSRTVDSPAAGQEAAPPADLMDGTIRLAFLLIVAGVLAFAGGYLLGQII